jgi:hypothetical protein
MSINKFINYFVLLSYEYVNYKFINYIAFAVLRVCKFTRSLTI